MDDIKVARKLLHLKSSAEKRGLEFNLSFTSVKNLLSSKKCFYTGVTFVDKEQHPLMLTIDRVDNNKGYIKGNVVACTKEFNEKKSGITMEDIKLLYKKLNGRM